MQTKKLIPLLLVCLAARSFALSPEGRKSGEDLVATLKEEINALDGGDGNENDLAAIRQYLRQVQNALALDSNRQIVQLLENHGNYEPTEKVAKIVESISQAIKEETTQKTRAIISDLETALATAAETVARAEEPEDLDKVIALLSRNRFNNDDGESYNSNNPTLRSLMSELSSARQFVTGWQDYLQASNTGNTAKAVQSLRNLSSQEKSLMPRSQIIARIEFELEDDDKVDKILNQVKKPDEMRDAIRKLNRLLGGSRSSSTENAGPREALQTLVKLERTYREHLAGLPVNVEVLQSPADTGVGMDSTQLRAALLLMVLPRALDLPEGFVPAAGEAVDSFLSRAIDDAKRREDTATALRIGSVLQSIMRSANFSDKEMAALRDYAAGRNQVAAGQYLLAVVSLQQALKAGSDLVPAAKAGELLETVRKEHPVEFEQGMMEFLTPRSAPEFDYSRMPYRNYAPPHMRYPDGDPIKPGGTTIILPVPGREEIKATPKPAEAVPAAGEKLPEATNPGQKAKTEPEK